MLWILAAALAAAPAAVSAETAVRSSSSSAQALLSESAVRLAVGDYAGSLALAQKAAAAAPNDSRAHLQIGVAELKLEDFPAAEAEAARAIELGYHKAAAYNVRSAARSSQGLFAEALADADKAVAANPDGPIGFFNRGAAKAGLKRPSDEILADFKRAAELDPSKYQARYQAAVKKYAVEAAAPKARPAAVIVSPQPVEPRRVETEPKAAHVDTPPQKPTPTPEPSSEEPPQEPTLASKPAVSVPAVAVPGRIWRSVLVGAAVFIVAFIIWLLSVGWKSHRLKQVRFGALITLPPPADELPPGAVVAGLYIVGRLLERRGAVEIYEARDLDDRPRVLKRTPLRPESAAEGLARARKAAALRVAGAERVESVFEAGRALCVCVQPLPGEPLARLRERLEMRRWQPEEALLPLQTACEALDEAHRQGLVHGGLTLASIWVERGRAGLADFAFGPSAGDPASRAPERELEPASDVYALARCFAHMLARDGAELPSSLKPVCERALDAEPSRRFRTAGELFGAYRSAVVPLVQ